MGKFSSFGSSIGKLSSAAKGSKIIEKTAAGAKKVNKTIKTVQKIEGIGRSVLILEGITQMDPLMNGASNQLDSAITGPLSAIPTNINIPQLDGAGIKQSANATEEISAILSKAGWSDEKIRSRIDSMELSGIQDINSDLIGAKYKSVAPNEISINSRMNDLEVYKQGRTTKFMNYAFSNAIPEKIVQKMLELMGSNAKSLDTSAIRSDIQINLRSLKERMNVNVGLPETYSYGMQIPEIPDFTSGVHPDEFTGGGAGFEIPTINIHGSGLSF